MTKAEKSFKYEVVIVGFGPVGCTLANILGQYGIRTLVLEREPGVYTLPRAVAFDDEVMRVFQSIGLSDAISKIVTIGGGAKFVDSTGKVLVNWVKPQTIGPNGWCVNNRFHQPYLERILRKGVARFECVSVKLEQQVFEIVQDRELVTVKSINHKKNVIEEFESAFVIGCDGARSFTRDTMDTMIDDLGFHEPWLVVDLKLETPEKESKGESIHYCDPERAVTQVFLGAGRKRWEFRLNSEDDPKRVQRPTHIWHLLRKWILPDQARLERAVIYTFHATIAKSWRLDRILIAGDAAHQTPPFMGQGMCAGIRDVTNLGWKLEYVLKKNGDLTILDSYQTERESHVRKFIDISIEMGKLINRTSASLLADEVISPRDAPQKLMQVYPALGEGLLAGVNKWSGAYFPQPRLKNGKLLDDYIGYGWALIVDTDFFSTFPEDLKFELSSLDIVIVSNLSKGLDTWLNERGVLAAIIRPDRHVLGACSELSDLRELLTFFKKK